MAGKGKAEGCASCAKWCLIIFNILFCLIGIALVAVGIYAYITLRDYLNILGDSSINAPAIVLIVFGVITFIIAALGCFGACKESPCLLFTFAVIIAMLLIAEIGAGIAAFVFRGEVEGFFDGKKDELLMQYKEGDDSAITDSWDKVHEQLECCGYNGPTDWADSNLAPEQAPKVPDSCKEYTQGCKDALIETVKDNIYIVGGAGIAFGVIELLGIVLACCVGCQARKGTEA